MYKRAIVLALLACLPLVGCGKATPPAETAGKAVAGSDNAAEARLVGRWKLTMVNGQNPASINLKTYEIEFLKDNHWKLEAAMKADSQGRIKRLKSAGIWKIDNGVMSYTVGRNKGVTKLTLKDDSLTLSPDPAIRPGGKTLATTAYARIH